MSDTASELTTDNVEALLLAESDSQTTVEAIRSLVNSRLMASDARKTAQTRADLNRWLGQTNDDDVREALTTGIASLGNELSELRLHRADSRNLREAGALATQIRELLVEPLRPKDLIEATGADPAQVTRAIGQLKLEGVVVDSPTPAASDGRARWYIQAAMVETRSIDELIGDAPSLVAVAAVDRTGSVRYYSFGDDGFGRDHAQRISRALQDV